MRKITISRRTALKGALLAVGAGITGKFLVNSEKNAPPNSIITDFKKVNYGPLFGVAKLNANENPYGPSASAIKAMNEAIQKGSYYVSYAQKLKEMIAERHNLTPSHIILGSGSSAPLQWLATKVTKEGHILGPDLFWDTTSKMGSANSPFGIERTAKTSDLAIDLKNTLAKITSETALVQITNPNNPTGLLIPPKQLSDFCKLASKETTILIDEAYNELTDKPQENTMIPLVREGYDVIVARTFSKIYGLAGMRVGYLLAKPETVSKIDSYGLGDYSLNQAGVAAAIASYNDNAFLKYSRDKILEGREMLAEAVTLNGLSFLPSNTNFMFVDLNNLNAEAFRKAMEEEKILVRGIYQDYTQWSRVSTGLIGDVSKYIQALPKVLEKISSL